MKILHIMNWFIEDLGYQENYLSFCQAQLGNEVKVLCSKYYPKGLRFLKRNNSEEEIKYAGGLLKVKRLKSFFWQFLTEQNWFFRLKEEIESFEPDIVHLHHIWILPTIQFLVTNFRHKKQIRIFVDDHIDNGNFSYKGALKFIYLFWFIKKIIIPIMLKRNFIFISVNPYSFHCLDILFGIPTEKIALLPLGLDNQKIFFSLQKRQALRNRYGLDEEDIVFTFSGLFQQNKSLKDLISAFTILSQRYPHIFLLMIGQGKIANDEGFIHLKNTGRIILAGWQPIAEIYQWYSMADIAVLPGKLGGIKDILAAGRPLIISDDLAVSYLLEYGNGLIFKKHDVQGLALCMEQYIRSPDLILEHGRKAARLVNDKLSWENIAIKSLEIYNNP